MQLVLFSNDDILHSEEVRPSAPRAVADGFDDLKLATLEQGTHVALGIGNRCFRISGRGGQAATTEEVVASRVLLETLGFEVEYPRES